MAESSFGRTAINVLNVYCLQNGNAEDMAKVLMNIPRDTKTTTQVGQPAQAVERKAPVLTKDVHVVADKATNTLIITANRDDYRTIEGVIRQLDMPRPMVYIEALIMEVSLTVFGGSEQIRWKSDDAFGGSNTFIEPVCCSVVVQSGR